MIDRQRFAVNSRVTHAHHGPGTVIEDDGSLTVGVRFDADGGPATLCDRENLTAAPWWARYRRQPWWKFWHPWSGWRGGALMGLLMFGLVKLIVRLFP